MTDPLRRDPREFLRVLKKMSRKTSWQKSLIFASKGRSVGFELGLEHYNAILFSQALWGRGLEIVNVIRDMQRARVRMNGVSYYYICHGMANVDHGWNYDFQVNHRLPGLQHWRVALNALSACEANGFDASDSMISSCVVACTIPGTNRWIEALHLVRKLAAEERNAHPQSIKFLTNCLTRNKRLKELNAVLRYADESNVPGYEGKSEVDIFRHLPNFSSDDPKTAIADPKYAAELKVLEPNSANQPHDSQGVFRPRVYRQHWYKWHAIANRYRPNDTLKKRQLAPKDSPTGIPGFYRL